MKDEPKNRLADALAGLVDRITNGMDDSAAFVADQLPPYVDQLLLWHTLASAFWFTLGVLIALTPFVVCARVAKRVRAGDIEWDEDCTAVAGIAALAVVAMGGFVMVVNLDWLQIAIAPKVWLVEYARGML